MAIWHWMTIASQSISFRRLAHETCTCVLTQRAAWGLPCWCDIIRSDELVWACPQLMTRSAARELFSNTRLQRWCFDVELIYLAGELRIPVVEVPVDWTEIPGELPRLAAVGTQECGGDRFECLTPFPGILGLSWCRLEDQGVQHRAHGLGAGGHPCRLQVQDGTWPLKQI